MAPRPDALHRHADEAAAHLKATAADAADVVTGAARAAAHDLQTAAGMIACPANCPIDPEHFVKVADMPWRDKLLQDIHDAVCGTTDGKSDGHRQRIMALEFQSRLQMWALGIIGGAVLVLTVNRVWDRLIVQPAPPVNYTTTTTTNNAAPAAASHP